MPMPRHRFWQIRLSTGIVLAIVCAGLLWLNLRPALESKADASFGWPLPFSSFCIYHGGKWHPEECPLAFSLTILADVTVWLALLSLAGCVAELRLPRWCRLHLSTALCLMLLASVLLWLNMRPPKVTITILETSNAGGTLYGIHYSGYGWPMQNRAFMPRRGEAERDATLAELESWLLCDDQYGRVNVAINAMFAIFVLGIAAVVCEWLIRRRSRQHP